MSANIDEGAPASKSARERILTAKTPPPHNINYESIPKGLASKKSWFCWRWEWNGEKYSKVPTQISGSYNASSTNPRHRVDFNLAKLTSQRKKLGLGYVFTNDGVVGVDIDDCRDPDTCEIAPWAAAIIAKLNTYCEVSPSGTGVKLWLIGELPDRFRKIHERPDGIGAVEIFNSGRYFTVTGQRLPGTPDDIQDRPNEMMDLYREVCGWKIFSANSLSDSPLASTRPTEPISDDRETVLAALAVISPDLDYDAWLAVGMALHSVDSSAGMLAAYDRWSQGSGQKYIAGSCEKKWESFGGGGVGIGTLCKMADDTGVMWRPKSKTGQPSSGNPEVEKLVESLKRGIKEIQRGDPVGQVVPSIQHCLDAIAAANQNLEIRTFGELRQEFTALRQPVIEGLLRRGEVMNVISAPKVGKSWLVMGLALAIASGRDWLGRFPVRSGKVLMVDNELHGETLADRLPKVAAALGLMPEDYQDRICVVTLRGCLVDLPNLCVKLDKLVPGEFDLIILDAWYRLQPEGTDENSNADVTKLYNILDSTAAKIQSAFACVHHSSKGNQSGKSVTDVGSGAGAQARAPDTHLVLRAHEEDGALVAAAEVRSWPPIDPFCLRRDFPVWSIDSSLDPSALRKEKQRKSSATTQKDAADQEREIAMKERISMIRILDAYAAQPDGETKSALAESVGMNATSFKPFFLKLLDQGFITPCRVKKGNGSHLGNMITVKGRDELRQLRQLRQTQEMSELSDSDNSDRQAPLKGGALPKSELSELSTAPGETQDEYFSQLEFSSGNTSTTTHPNKR